MTTLDDVVVRMRAGREKWKSAAIDKEININDNDLLTIKKPFTAKHITLINNEIELEDAVADMKACKAKLKGASKRVDELQKLRRALMVDSE